VRKFIFALVLLPLAALLAGSLAVSHAQPLRVADGDTIELGGQRIRLNGIDAPELHQECRDASGRNWACGRRARSELRKMIGNDAVQCTSHVKDRFGRSVAVCRAGGRDLGEAMVRSGWALAYPDWASPYGAAQSEARSRKLGLWAGSFENPRAWRDEHPRDDRRDNRPGITRYGGDIIPRAAQDWLRERSRAAGQSVMRWVRSFWAGKPAAEPGL
jgi:endonuclease YncB( thermonuclease family)